LNSVNLCYTQTLFDEKERSRKRSLKHYPSGACAVLNGTFLGKCRRATWFDWKDADKTNPPDAPALFKMRVGDLIHEHLDGLLNRALEREGWSLESYSGENGSITDGVGAETALAWQSPDLKYPVSGRLDKRMVKDGYRIVAEWKSTYGRGSDDVQKNGPKEDALLQCICYLEQDIFPVDEVLLMYAGRDTGYLQGFSITKCEQGLKVEWMGSSKVTFSALKWDNILLATQELEGYLEQEVPPIKDYGSSSPDKSQAWRCSYCNYKALCDRS